MIRLEAITKSFGGVPALRGVSLRVRAGAVHGLLGENGAGKSTLMNILFGLLRPDAGQIFLENSAGTETAVTLPSPRAAQRHGIGMVHQHFKLVPSLTILENLALARQSGFGFTQRRAMQRALQKWSETLGWRIDGAQRVGALSVGEQQRVEIIRALLAGGRILILDEPTAVLTPQEIRELFPAIRRLTRGDIGPAGDSAPPMSVIFISHKLAEVETLCDDITILRQGRVVHTGPASALSIADMAAKMVGTKVEIPRLNPDDALTSSPATAPPVLELRDVHTPTAAGHAPLRGASLAVRSGEIVGIAGVDGNGQTALAHAIVGAQSITSGTLLLTGQPANHWPIRRRLSLLAYVPGDRHAEAVALSLSLVQNMMMKEYRTPPFARHGILNLSRWRSHTAQFLRAFDVRYASARDPLGALSGGNQQKLVLARELHTRKPLVIAVNPTRGLDIGATAFVMRQLLEARRAGAAVLLIHSDLDELLAISSRVLVLYNGTLRDSRWPHATKESIGRLMLGVTEPPSAAEGKTA